LWNEHAERIRNPVVNPLYKVSGSAGKWRLNKQNPGASGKLSAGGPGFLPEAIEIDLPSLRTEKLLELKAADPAAFADLAKQFVVIDVPERFL
jgi:hypothetical protein